MMGFIHKNSSGLSMNNWLWSNNTGQNKSLITMTDFCSTSGAGCLGEGQ
jgi:hypothetical protein